MPADGLVIDDRTDTEVQQQEVVVHDYISELRQSVLTKSARANNNWIYNTNANSW